MIFSTIFSMILRGLWGRGSLFLEVWDLVFWGADLASLYTPVGGSGDIS